MADNQVYEDIKGLIVDRLGVDEDRVNQKTSLKDDLGADSLDVVELVMEIEDKYGLEISDEDAENIETVGDAVEYIETHHQSAE